MLLIDTYCGKQFSIMPNRYTQFSTSELNSSGLFSLRFGKTGMSLLVNRGNGRELYAVSLVTYI